MPIEVGEIWCKEDEFVQSTMTRYSVHLVARKWLVNDGHFRSEWAVYRWEELCMNGWVVSDSGRYLELEGVRGGGDKGGMILIWIRVTIILTWFPKGIPQPEFLIERFFSCPITFPAIGSAIIYFFENSKTRKRRFSTVNNIRGYRELGRSSLRNSVLEGKGDEANTHIPNWKPPTPFQQSPGTCIWWQRIRRGKELLYHLTLPRL